MKKEFEELKAAINLPRVKNRQKIIKEKVAEFETAMNIYIKRPWWRRILKK